MNLETLIFSIHVYVVLDFVTTSTPALIFKRTALNALYDQIGRSSYDNLCIVAEIKDASRTRAESIDCI
jgi:hypothetical protein